MKKPLLIFLPLCLIGCAQLNEKVVSMSAEGEAPEDAPPGYFSFEKGKEAAEKDDYQSATTNYCYAADLGHPQAEPYCVKYAVLSAQSTPFDICRAKNYNDRAKELCSRFVKKGPDYVKAQARNMVLEQESQKQAKGTKRKNAEKGI